MNYWRKEEKMNKLLNKFFTWIFKQQLEDLQRMVRKASTTNDQLQAQLDRVRNILGNMDVSVDVHYHSPSWAVISIQGEKSDYIKFVDLGKRDIMEISRFLSQFERGKIDAHPYMVRALKNELWKI